MKTETELVEDAINALAIDEAVMEEWHRRETIPGLYKEHKVAGRSYRYPLGIPAIPSKEILDDLKEEMFSFNRVKQLLIDRHKI